MGLIYQLDVDLVLNRLRLPHFVKFAAEKFMPVRPVALSMLCYVMLWHVIYLACNGQ